MVCACAAVDPKIAQLINMIEVEANPRAQKASPRTPAMREHHKNARLRTKIKRK